MATVKRTVSTKCSTAGRVLATQCGRKAAPKKAAAKPAAKTAAKPVKKTVVKKAAAPAKPRISPGAKVGPVGITIHWAEGDNSKYDRFPKTYKTYAAAQKALIPVFKDNQADGGGGYNKTKFSIKFKDGTDYEGRLDINEREDNPVKYKNLFEKHILDHVNYYIKNPYPGMTEAAKKEYASFATKYKLRD